MPLKRLKAEASMIVCIRYPALALLIVGRSILRFMCTHICMSSCILSGFGAVLSVHRSKVLLRLAPARRAVYVDA